MTTPPTLSVLPITGLPEITAGADLASMIAERADLMAGDVVVVTQKIVSKAEGRVVAVDPDDANAKRSLVEAESVRVLRQRGELLVTETRHGFVCANSGVDFSNIAEGYAALLPVDSDRSARRVRDGLRARTGLQLGVIVSDTFGRAWRRGVTDIAIGCAGIRGIIDLRGTTDALGRTLVATEVCAVDEIAGAAELVMGKASGVPVAVVRGIDPSFLAEGSVGREVVRAYGEDLFR